MKTVKIDIVSDIACPWCAIGYARLEEAMQRLQHEFKFDIEWHAFELNPDPTAPSEPIADVLVSKYGRSREEIDRIQEEMVLESDAHADDVRADEARYRRAGVSAVPA